MKTTNREKYIDSMTDKELALFLSCGSQIIDNQIDTNPSLTDDEEIRKQAARNCEEIEKWLSQKVELTADEMFEELGYEKMKEDKCVFGYIKAVNSKIIIIEITYQGKREITFSKSGAALADNITEAEDKAIHKKIEELKNEV